MPGPAMVESTRGEAASVTVAEVAAPLTETAPVAGDQGPLHEHWT